MKTFNYFFAEAEDKAPLNLNEAADLFDFFYEELSEVERFLVVESLDEEDLYNILWLEEYLAEAELVPGAANNAVPFKRGKFNKKGNPRNSIPDPWGNSTVPPKKSNQQKTNVTPNSQQYDNPIQPQRGTSNLKIGKSGLETAADVARKRESGTPPTPSKPGVKQSLKNFGSTVKNVAGKVINAPTAAGTATGNVLNKGLQKVPGVRNVQAANLRMNRKISSQVSKLKGSVKTGATKVPGGTKALGALKGLGSVASKAAVPVDAALNVANRKMQGQSWKRSIAGGATETAGGLAGASAGAALGTAILPGVGTVVGGIGGYMAGSGAAGKAFDTAAGKTPQQLKADQVKNRQRQAGGGLSGIGGKTTFSKAKDGTGFMSTGSGSQRKTVQLAKTSVVKDPTTGKSEVGHLAFKGGRAVYKRADAPGTGTTNPFERIGRTLNPNAYKANDAKLAAQKLQQAAKSDIKRQQALGVKGSQNLVGPKIVGPKIVGPKIVGPKPAAYKPAGGGMGGGRGSGSNPSVKK